MRWSHRTPVLAVGLAALTLGVAACGGDDDDGGSANEGTPAQGKQGGKLTMLSKGDVDYVDAGQTYYVLGDMLANATQRPLYGLDPTNSKTVPDLADGEAQISSDAKSVRVKIKKGVRFSPPVRREVTSKDVKYAVERGFFKSVANGYAGAYFGDIVGAKEAVKAGTTIDGITTPDKYTIEFKLSKPTAGITVGAMSMPVTAPVPKEYAAKFDRESTSKYGENQVATGPYMIRNNAEGKAIGYKPTRRIELVRNPSWNKASDYKPAYLDEIDIREGNDDSTVASNRILDGQSMVTGDVVPLPPTLKKASTRYEDQLTLVNGGGGRWVAMNSKIKPFDDLNVRKAVIAGFNREAMLKTRGGRLIGKVPTHLIPPGVQGFEEAGGEKGPGYDFLAKPQGDPALSAEYFKKAGYASGKYEGSEPLLMVGTNEGVAQKAAEVAKENFERMGFTVRLRLVTQDSMYTKFCNVRKSQPAICPNVGWVRDFPDAQTYLDPTFNGDNIVEENNNNWLQLDDPKINAAMDKAAEAVAPEDRAKAWGEIDKQVTAQAPGVLWAWDNQPVLSSKNVNVVGDPDTTLPSLTFTSLK